MMEIINLVFLILMCIPTFFIHKIMHNKKYIILPSIFFISIFSIFINRLYFAEQKYEIFYIIFAILLVLIVFFSNFMLFYKLFNRYNDKLFEKYNKKY